MYIAAGRMRGNMGTFVNDNPDAEDIAEATMELRNSYTTRITESSRVEVAKRASPDEAEEIQAILDGSSPKAKHYRIQKLEGHDLYFIEGFYQVY